MNINDELKKRFSGKKVAILGCGKEGMAVAEFLVKYGALIELRDMRRADEIKAAISNFQFPISNLKEISMVGGEDYLKGLDEVDVIVRSPGIPYLTAEIQEAKKNGVEVTSQTEIFLQYYAHQTIAVTGTKGKSTTSSLIYQLLLDGGKTVRYGGNIGTAFIEWLGNISHKEIIVLELSSFQLQGLAISPHVAVVQDITVEHLNHHKTLDEYVEAKSNIVQHQHKKDLAILNADSLTSVKFTMLTQACTTWFSTRKYVDPGVFVKKYNGSAWIVESGILINKKIINSSNIKLQGEHNLSNICAAVAAALSYGVSYKSIRQTLSSFSGLPHRLVEIGKYAGRIWIDDAFSTAPDSTEAAIQAYAVNNPLVIIGGSSKGYGFENLASRLISNGISKVLLVGDTAKEIKQCIQDMSAKQNVAIPEIIIENTKSMKEIVRLAEKSTSEGDYVLFSPGCASFGMFKNVYDRASQFENEVQLLND
jgi:UDP-N-acetylmuramoylalanine--D-glutamate ligase